MSTYPFHHTYWSLLDALRYGELDRASDPIYVDADVWVVEAHLGYPVIYSTT